MTDETGTASRQRRRRTLYHRRKEDLLRVMKVRTVRNFDNFIK
jgi:hypothetical protein